MGVRKRRQGFPVQGDVCKRVAAQAAVMVLFVSAAAMSLMSPLAHASPVCFGEAHVIPRTGGWTTVTFPRFPTEISLPIERGEPWRVYDYAVDPSRPNRILVASYDTLQLSEDGGCTWDIVFRVPRGIAQGGTPMLGCPEFGVHRNSRVPWVDTAAFCSRIYSLDMAPLGERIYMQVISRVLQPVPGAFVRVTSPPLTGIFVSNDGGRTWTEETRDASLDSVRVELGIGHLNVSERDPETVYVTRSIGSLVEGQRLQEQLFVSNNGGRSWTEQGLLPGVTDNSTMDSPPNDASRFIVDPSDPRELWGVFSSPVVGTFQSPVLYHSFDAGRSWEEVSLPDGNTLSDLDVFHRPGQLPQLVIVRDGQLHVSGDGGGSWSQLREVTGLQTDVNGETGFLPYQAVFGKSASYIFSIDAARRPEVMRYDVRRGIATAIKSRAFHPYFPDNFSEEYEIALRHIGAEIYLMGNCSGPNGPCGEISFWTGKGA